MSLAVQTVAIAVSERAVQMVVAAELDYCGVAIVSTSEAADVAIADAVNLRFFAVGHPVILLVANDPGAAIQAVRQMKAGMVRAAVCVDRVESLRHVVRLVSEGCIVLCDSVIRLCEDVPSFSERQYDLMAALVRGFSNKRIARTLGVAEITVKRDLRSIAELLGVSGRSEMLAAITRLGVGDVSRGLGDEGGVAGDAGVGGVVGGPRPRRGRVAHG